MGKVVISEENTFFAFDPSIRPAATVDPGDTVVFHTKDCFSNQLLSEEQLVTTIDFSGVNPATGVSLRQRSRAMGLVARGYTIDRDR